MRNYDGTKNLTVDSTFKKYCMERGQKRSERQRNRPELCRLKDVPKPKLTGSKTRTTERIFDVSRDSHVLENTVLGCKPQEVRVKIAEKQTNGLGLRSRVM